MAKAELTEIAAAVPSRTPRLDWLEKQLLRDDLLQSEAAAHAWDLLQTVRRLEGVLTEVEFVAHCENCDLRFCRCCHASTEAREQPRHVDGCRLADALLRARGV